ncbi:unnamed protein product [Parnassius apollo]|uniref:(apollo) hypothetical protein n=1 Tax=Parnassius apollo TaxID=110799 RepID=A0A8S3X1J8_PARAO|nr:unnamed protein product [Parnassius apollo]
MHHSIIQVRNETTTPEHRRSGESRLHSATLSKNRYPAAVPEKKRRQQQSDNMKLKRTMFGRSMTSTEELTTHSQEVNDHSSCDGYVGSHDGPHLTAASTSNSENSNREVMQIVNNTCTDKTDTFKPVKMITVYNLSVKALVDLGSDVNIILSECYKALGQPKAENDNTI